MKYRFVGDHPEDLDDGRVLEPGQFVDLDADELDGVRVGTLVEDGKLLSIESFESPNATEAAISAAKESGVSLAEVTGTGQGSRITKDDVDNFVQSKEGGAGQ